MTTITSSIVPGCPVAVAPPVTCGRSRPAFSSSALPRKATAAAIDNASAFLVGLAGFHMTRSSAGRKPCHATNRLVREIRRGPARHAPRSSGAGSWKRQFAASTRAAESSSADRDEPEQATDRRRDGHSEAAAGRGPDRRAEDGGATETPAHSAQHRQADRRGHDDRGDAPGRRREEERRDRQQAERGEARRRDERGLERARPRSVFEPELVAHVRDQPVSRRELLRDLLRERGVQAPLPVDRGELAELVLRIRRERPLRCLSAPWTMWSPSR